MYQGYFEKSEKELITNKGSCLNTDSFFLGNKQRHKGMKNFEITKLCLKKQKLQLLNSLT